MSLTVSIITSFCTRFVNSMLFFLPTVTLEYHSFYMLSLPNLYFYTRFWTMFLKVTYTNLNCLLLYYWLTPVRKFWLESLAINHSSSEINYIFLPDGLLKLSHVLLILQHAWVRTFRHLHWITRFGLAPFASAVATQRIFDWGGGVWFVILSYEYIKSRKMYWLCLFWLQADCIFFSVYLFIFFENEQNKSHYTYQEITYRKIHFSG